MGIAKQQVGNTGGGGGGGSQDLKQVTDIGSTTDNDISLTDGASLSVQDDGLIENIGSSGTTLQMFSDVIRYRISSFRSDLIPDTMTGNRIWTLPDKTGTLAMLDDITGGDLQSTLDNGSDATMTADINLSLGGNTINIGNDVSSGINIAGNDTYLGDWAGGGNNTIIHIDDANLTVNVGNRIFIDLNNGTVDITPSASASIHLDSNGEIRMGDVGDTDNGFGMKLNSVTQLATIGDIDNLGSGTRFTVDDVNARHIFTNILQFADNTAALAGGLIIGCLYRTGDLLKIVH